MPDYKNGMIYKLICNDISITENYIGSCCDYNKRKGNHECDCYNINRPHYNQYKYRFIRENGGIDNWSMIKVKEFPCNSKRELEFEERMQMDLLGGELNTKRTFITEEERKISVIQYKKKYRENNNEEIIEKERVYRELNKDKINKTRKQKFECKCGGKYTIQNKARHMKTKTHINNSKVSS